MPRLPDSYWSRRQRVERLALEDLQRGTVDVGRPRLRYDIEFVRSELERYDRDWRWFYEGPKAERPDKVEGWNPHGKSIVVLYRNGFLSTFAWFLGVRPSPIHGHPAPPTEQTFSDEQMAANVMEGDTDLLIYGGSNTTVEDVYGEFEPWYVRAVYKTLNWVNLSESERQDEDYIRMYDPITW